MLVVEVVLPQLLGRIGLGAVPSLAKLCRPGAKVSLPIYPTLHAPLASHKRLIISFKGGQQDQ
jgi:hypothetical protein